MNNKLTLLEIDGHIFIEIDNENDSFEFKIVAPRKLGVINNEKIIEVFDVSPESVRKTIKNNGLWLVNQIKESDIVEIYKYKLAS